MTDPQRTNHPPVSGYTPPALGGFGVTLPVQVPEGAVPPAEAPPPDATTVDPAGGAGVGEGDQLAFLDPVTVTSDGPARGGWFAP